MFEIGDCYCWERWHVKMRPSRSVPQPNRVSLFLIFILLALTFFSIVLTSSELDTFIPSAPQCHPPVNSPCGPGANSLGAG